MSNVPNKIKNIIVQAGGLGTRLETLTLNKPKCIVPIDNLPIIFYLFKKFPDANFKIIADYKADVLDQYLKIFSDVNYKLIIPTEKGTASGIKKAISNLNNEPLMIIWSDLILGDNFETPALDKNYVGISQNFECRWSFVDGNFVKEPSVENGVAGLFIFKSPQEIKDIYEGGEFVKWLQSQNLKFERLILSDTKEIGTMLAYQANEPQKQKCRPFNKMEFENERVIKYPITEQGEKIAKDEINWYKTIQKYNFKDIPAIYNYEPLTLEKIEGKNIFEYTNFTKSQKQGILEKIITMIKSLHSLDAPIEANLEDCYDNYFAKTFYRLEKVRTLIPFADKEFIRINDAYYKNVFFIKDDLEKSIKEFFPDKFNIIHGDVTFSNLMLKTQEVEPVMIDPRGYFGKTKVYGDADYDWAKLYYSIAGNYDQFNRKNFSLEILENRVFFNVSSNGWEDMEEFFFHQTGVNQEKIKLLHSIIWLSLTTYTWEDYDSICAAFYKGLLELNKVI